MESLAPTLLWLPEESSLQRKGLLREMPGEILPPLGPSAQTMCVCLSCRAALRPGEMHALQPSEVPAMGRQAPTMCTFLPPRATL